MKSIPNSARAIAVLAALVLIVLEAALMSEEPSALAVLLLLGAYSACGQFMGSRWPAGSWTWGLWLAGPMLLATVARLVISGPDEAGSFLVPVTALTLACLGGLLGARYSPRNAHQSGVSETDST